jgi:hypothetical protein
MEHDRLEEQARKDKNIQKKKATIDCIAKLESQMAIYKAKISTTPTLTLTLTSCA